MNERLPSLWRTGEHRLRGVGLAPTPEGWGRSTLALRVELGNSDVEKLQRILEIQGQNELDNLTLDMDILSIQMPSLSISNSCNF